MAEEVPREREQWIMGPQCPYVYSSDVDIWDRGGHEVNAACVLMMISGHSGMDPAWT